MKDGFVIIDGHVHTFSNYEVAKKIIDSFNNIYDIAFENPGTGAIDDVLANMDRSGVDYTVMANFAPPKILHANNLWTIDTAKQNSRLVPLVSFHPAMQGRLWSFLECYMNEGAKGVKLHPMAQGFKPDNRRFDEVYRYCSDTVFPVVFHCGRVANARLNEFSDLDMILPVVDRYPEIPFVLTHMADGNTDDVLRMANNYGNVYFDTSIVITGYPPIMKTNIPSWLDDSAVVDIINAIGAERVIFGSDYPWGSPGHDMQRIFGMKLDDSQKRRIFSENSMKIFRLDM